MGKQTKRARKFEKKGGVKARLEKGTITKKGKLKRTTKRTGNTSNEEASNQFAKLASDSARIEQERKRKENDFVNEANVGDLDMDSFFETFDKQEEKEEKDASDDEPQEGEPSSDDSKDDDDDSEESGDEEDIEAASAKMQLEMDKLASSDPDFHKYLKNNERSLLKFGGDEAVASADEDIDDDDEEEEKPNEPKNTQVAMSKDLLKSMHMGAFRSHGIKGLRKVVSAYKSACHLSDPSEDDNETKSGTSYSFDTSASFDQLMLMCLNNCHEEFHYHLLGKGTAGANVSESKQKKKKTSKKDEDEEMEDEDDDDDVEFDANKPLNPKLLMKSYRWPEVKPILQSFLKSTIHILNESKEPKLRSFVLKSLSSYLPYLTPFPRVATTLLSTLTSLWSAPLDSSEDYQVVRLNAFLRIRQLALTQPFPFIEECLKKSYLAYAKRAKFGTASSVTTQLPTLTFMGNCVVELYSLDYHSAYQHAFVYVRQLALHLRTALQKKTVEAFQIVYCWQYMHCLKLWTAVLAAALTQPSFIDDGSGRQDDSQLLRSLVYPLVEVISGVTRLVPSTRNLPLRMLCVRLLQQLAAASEMYISTTSILLEALDLKEMHMKPKRMNSRSTTRGLVLPLVLKLPKEATLRTVEQLEACISEVFLLLNREVELYRYSAGFPEFSVRICQHLRKFSKETKNARWRAYSRGCIDLCDRHSTFAVKCRSVLNEAPKDVKRLEILKPADAPNMNKRHDASVSKEKPLEGASRPATSLKRKAEEEVPKPEPDVAEEKNSKKKKKPKEVKPPRKVNKADLDNTKSLEQQDEVEEGVDWLDSD